MASEQTHLSLQDSEASVLAAASTIFAAYVQAGYLASNDERHVMAKAVDSAIQLAGMVDQKVVSDDELDGAKGSALQPPQVFTGLKRKSEG